LGLNEEKIYDGFGVAVHCTFVVALLEEAIALLLPVHGRAHWIRILFVFLLGAGGALLRFTLIGASEGGSGLVLPLLL
jgi:hypothetical protein